MRAFCNDDWVPRFVCDGLRGGYRDASLRCGSAFRRLCAMPKCDGNSHPICRAFALPSAQQISAPDSRGHGPVSDPQVLATGRRDGGDAEFDHADGDRVRLRVVDGLSFRVEIGEAQVADVRAQGLPVHCTGVVFAQHVVRGLFEHSAVGDV